ncbi:MAG: porin family protein [Mariprofundus sp.]
MKSIMMTILAILAMSGVARAQEVTVYTGVGMGAFGLEYADPTMKIKSTVAGGYVKLGVNLDDYVGFEVRLGTTGNGSKTPGATTVKQSMSRFVSYLAKLQLPLTDDFRLYMMLGGTSGTYKQKYSPSLPGIGASQSLTKSGFSYGVGGELNLGDHLSVGTEWMQYWTNVKFNAVGSKMKLWGGTGTLNYNF